MVLIVYNRHLGLMLIAQVLKDDGHIVKIHDPALEGWKIEKFWIQLIT